MDTQVRSWCRALRALAALNLGLWLAVALAGPVAGVHGRVQLGLSGV